MKLRRLVAVAASVAVLTAVIAAPVSAETPPTVKIGSRGVSYGIQTIATNCPADEATVGAMKAMGAAGTIIGRQQTQSPCDLGPVPQSRATAPRDPVDLALKAKTSARSEATAKSAIVWGEDYYYIEAYTTRVVFGEAGSGDADTGLLVDRPVTGILYIAWIYDPVADLYDLYEGVTDEQADYLLSLEDLAGGAASTWIPGLGYLDVECIGVGAWGRVSDTITGGIDPNDGWTYDLTSRLRWCVTGVTMNGTELPFSKSLLDRTMFTTVDVYPY